jgi:hypothetical protein
MNERPLSRSNFGSATAAMSVAAELILTNSIAETASQISHFALA